MKKFLLLILLFSSLIASSVQQKINLTSDEKLFIKQHPVIEVGGELDWPPFDFVVDGKYRCVANDYLELISQRTGLKFNVTTGYSWNELLKMFHEKKFDLMPMIYISPERAKSFSFTKKYLTVREYIFVTQDQQNIATFDDLAHLTLAVPKGYAQIEIIHKKYPNINILEVGSPLDAIDALLTQKADAMLENTAVVAYMLKQNHITGLKPAFATDIGINELYMATQKDMPQLLSIVQKALDSITKDEKEKIENRWMSVVATHVGIDLTQEEKDFIKQHPVIRVSNEKNWAPYDYNEGGEPKGYAVEYIKMLSQMSGLKLEFVTDSWDNLMQNFQERKIDLLNIAYKTQKREENALFSDSYLENDLSIVTQIREKRFYNLESLSGQKVALVKGWTSTEEIKKKYPKIEVYEVKDSLELVEAVAHGDVVAGIDDLLTINYYTKLKLLPNLRLAGNVELEDISTKMFIGVRKDWPLLQQILNKAIQQVDSANLLEFNSKWLHQHQLNFTQRIELTHAEQHYLQKKKRILFCTDTQLEPWSTINNGYNVGMSADISGLFSNIIGVPVELKLTKTNAEAVETAKKRGCDILLARVKSQVAQKYMDFTSPYMENSVVIITGIDQAFLNDFSELAGKKIGIIKGDFINQALKFKYPKISFIEVDTLEEGLDKVADKELDGQLSALFIGSYFIQKKYLNVLKISGMSSVTMQLRIATRNDEPLLNSVFEKAIQILDRKELRRIANKWTDQSHEKEIDYSLVWKLVILFILVILFFISRNRQLTKHKKEIELKNKELENTNKNLEEQKKKVDFIAFHDHLTGLPNRRNLRERLEHAIGIAKRNDKKVYTLFIDLDRFKIVNDTLGHDIGDEMLKVVATRLQSLLRKSDTLAREGGDEFIIVGTSKNLV